MERLTVASLALASALVYYFSNPAPAHVFDQTFTIAGAFLSGHLGVRDPRPWLELAPGVDQHYSVFPLGAVLTMLPLAALARVGLFSEFPSAALSASQAALLFVLSDALAAGYGLTLRPRLVLSLFLLFGNWTWCNLVFGGAWHYSLGFSMLGQMAALYFVLVRRAPLLAGACYAVALGNRTEILAVLPIFGYLLLPQGVSAFGWRESGRDLLRFAAAPAALVLLTCAYNYARFQSVLDFGYQRIPYVQDEDLYSDGLFSPKPIPANARAMLWQPWKRIDRFPNYAPNGFGESILLCSPFLVCLIHGRARKRGVKKAAWLAVGVVTLVLWCHGNPGGYQYGYRYAMTLLPWFLLILIEGSPPAPGLLRRVCEDAVLILSIAISAYAVFAFYWATPGEYV